MYSFSHSRLFPYPRSWPHLQSSPLLRPNSYSLFYVFIPFLSTNFPSLSVCLFVYLTFIYLLIYLFVYTCMCIRRRQWHPTPVLLPGKSHGQRSLVGCSPRGCEESVQLSNFPFTFHFHALEKEMATHSNVLAWRIPGTGEPDELPSMGSHGVGYD